MLWALLPEALRALRLLGHASAPTAARRIVMLLDRLVALEKALRAEEGRRALRRLVRAAAWRVLLMLGRVWMPAMVLRARLTQGRRAPPLLGRLLVLAAPQRSLLAVARRTLLVAVGKRALRLCTPAWSLVGRRRAAPLLLAQLLRGLAVGLTAARLALELLDRTEALATVAQLAVVIRALLLLG